MSSARHVARMG